MTRPCILIGTPAYTGQLSHDYVNSLLSTFALFRQRGIDLKYYVLPGCSILPLARNAIAGAFLDSDATHCLWIDGDMGWHPNDVLRLLNRNLPLVAGVGALRGGGTAACSFEQGEPIEIDQDAMLLRCQSVGFAFVLTRRDCIETMVEAYPDRHYRDGDSGPLADLFPMGAIDGRFFGEDQGFCRLWREIGGEVWIDLTVKLRHVGIEFDPIAYFQPLLRPVAA